MAALADPTRRAIFELVALRPCSVAEMTRAMPVSQPAVSQHLKVLREAHLVTAQPNGARHIYRVNSTGLSEIQAWLDRMWATALDDFKAEADKHKEKKR